MILLFDIGNTHTHLGLANGRRVVRRADIPTAVWFDGTAARHARTICRASCTGGHHFLQRSAGRNSTGMQKHPATLEFETVGTDAKTVRGVGIDYPKPNTIGPDRLANAVAARHHFGAPVVVVDFGTAVTFDVINRAGDYTGGIIAPGLAAMTDYLHEKTALLPRIKIREIKTGIGRSTEEAMLIGAVHGYRGLVRELIAGLKRELKVKRLPVVATGGYAGLIAARLPEISAVKPALTLEGLRLTWAAACVPLL